jgi:endonuclease VIII
VVHVHLGLYGKFSDIALPLDPPRGLVRMRIVGPTHYADLRGPTACELITDAEVTAIHARLGEDPLRPDADPERAWARISRSRAPLATLLMDQKVIAGVGNVYRAEVLFRHGLDPLLPGRGLRREQWDAVWADLVALMRDGVRRGKIETLRPEHVPPPGERGARKVYVYRRTGDPCLVCGTPVARETHLARNLFWCPACQPAAA